MDKKEKKEKKKKEKKKKEKKKKKKEKKKEKKRLTFRPGAWKASAKDASCAAVRGSQAAAAAARWHNSRSVAGPRPTAPRPAPSPAPVAPALPLRPGPDGRSGRSAACEASFFVFVFLAEKWKMASECLPSTATQTWIASECFPPTATEAKKVEEKAEKRKNQ